MKRLVTYSGLLLVALALLVTCAEQGPKKPTPTLKSLLSIQDFAAIAGKWEGPVNPDPLPANAAKDRLVVVITPEGAYHLSSAPDVNMFKTSGKLILKFGQAVDQNEKEKIAFALYEETGGKRTLQAWGIVKDGKEYWAGLARSNGKKAASKRPQ
jgi:hypothetical protein